MAADGLRAARPPQPPLKLAVTVRRGRRRGKCGWIGGDPKTWQPFVTNAYVRFADGTRAFVALNNLTYGVKTAPAQLELALTTNGPFRSRRAEEPPHFRKS